MGSIADLQHLPPPQRLQHLHSLSGCPSCQGCSSRCHLQGCSSCCNLQGCRPCCHLQHCPYPCCLQRCCQPCGLCQPQVATHTITNYNNPEHYTAVSNGVFGPKYIAKNGAVQHVVKREAEAE